MSVGLLLLCASPTIALSPAALLRRMHAYHTAARPPAAFRPDKQYAPLRDLLEAGTAAAASGDAAARGTAGAAAELASMGPMYQRAATDGELLEEGVEQLLDLLRPAPDACFADLGSGRAEALMHVAARDVYKGCFGIELVESRHKLACRTLASAVEGGMLFTPIRLVHGDLAEIASLAELELSDDATAAAGADDFIRSDAGDNLLLPYGGPSLPPPIAGVPSPDLPLPTPGTRVLRTPPNAGVPSLHTGVTLRSLGAGTVFLRDTTHVFACSVCYDDLLLRAMTDALTNRQLFPRFQILVSLRALPSTPSLF
jgi:hypothetical protein